MAWHSYHTQRWREGWLLAALVVALLPSALNLPLPLTYPDAWRAAIGLPIAVVLAGYGAGIVAHSLQQLLGRVGIGAAIVLVVISLVFIGNDARLHYNNIALPTYERAAPFIEQP